MKVLLTAISCIGINMCAGPSVKAEIAGSIAPPPEAGVSDEYLVSLGTAAVPFLAGQLLDLKNEKYFRGLVHRLWQWGEKHEDPRAIQGLIDFVERFSKQKMEIPSESVYAMEDALRWLGWLSGYLDNPNGLNYLISWFTKKRYDKVRCSTKDHPQGSKHAKFRLNIGATAGLGSTGFPRALQVLRRLQKDLPESPKSWQETLTKPGVIRDAIRRIEEMQKVGVKKYLWQHHPRHPERWPKRPRKKGEPQPMP